jgi:hypothetical protein
MKSGIVRRDGMAPGVKRQAQSETAVLTRLGCALLKQSPRVRNIGDKGQIAFKGYYAE